MATKKRGGKKRVSKKVHVRDAKTGRYVKSSEAKRRPSTTVSESTKKRKRKRKKS